MPTPATDWLARRDASRALLRLANRGPRKTEFLREASRLIFRATGAATLGLWLEDGEQVLVWRGASDDADFDFRPVPARAVERPLADGVARILGEQRPLQCARRGAAGSSVWRSGTDGHWLALIPLEIDEANQGLLVLTTSDRSPGDAELEVYQELAGMLGVAIATRRGKAALAERVKELSCMYRIAQLGAADDLTLDDLLQRTVELLPPAWQYPEIATAQVALDDRVFRSTDFATGPHRLSADISVWGVRRGRVEVFYVIRDDAESRNPLLEETPFLEEEHHLIEGVAREISSIIERKDSQAEQARLHDQLRHADRLATIGQLAAGVAHELNEPLANILGFAQLALKASDLREQTRADIERIVDASLYSREIIKKLMFFARQTPSRESAVDLNAIVREALSLLATRCEKAGLDVHRELDPDAPRLRGDHAQLQQVLVNLAVNAIQAMASGGTLTVRTRVETGWVSLAVEDTGAGIEPDALPRIFEPFFTTKDVGEGTGLGLSVVHGIVTAHGGTVRVDSEVGRGTSFEVRLPARSTGD